MIGIYIDASRKIGIGHLQRCIRLRKVFPSKKTIFFTRSKNLKRTFDKEKVSHYLIKSKAKFIKFIKDKKIKIIIFDIRKFDNFLKNIFFFNKNTKSIFTVLIANSLKDIKGPNLVFFPVSVKKKTKKQKNLCWGKICSSFKNDRQKQN
jgi:spore coat polysaccharide biosynthesis predicted glycosyltransferase SpsG